MDYTKYLYFLIAVPPIIIAAIEIVIKLKERSSIKKKYNQLLKEYNVECIILVNCYFGNNRYLSNGDYYLGADRNGLIIISPDATPKVLKISYGMIPFSKLSFTNANSTKLNYAKNETELEIKYYSNEEMKQKNNLDCRIIFRSYVLHYSRHFNKYAFKQYNFYEYIRQNIPEKTMDITI